MTATASIRAAVGQDMQRQRQINMYGCTEADLRDSIESSITFKISGLDWIHGKQVPRQYTTPF